MNFNLIKTWTYKLLAITIPIVFVLIINTAQAQEKEATRLKVLENAIYYDENTGLEWLTGPDKATNWYDAKKWVDSLAAAGGGWRMPSMDELKTIYQKRHKCNIKTVFKTTGCWVWSGEIKGSAAAWGYDYLSDPGGSILSGGQGDCAGPDFLKRDDSNESTRGFAVRSRK